VKLGFNHKERKALFQRGIREGCLAVSEIERALPPGSLTPSERWLLYYSLRAAGVTIRDDSPSESRGPPPSGDHRNPD
jgi:hypothetical protein